MRQSTDAAYSYCLETLRDTDRDRYLACLLSPPDKRGPLASLYAFNAEIARIRDLVREPLPGEIRMQWWRDVLDGGGEGDSTANPLAVALLETIQVHGLPVPVLQNLIDARVFDLYDDPMESSGSLEGYAGETASAVIQLASLILDPPNAAASATAAGHAGVAQAVAGILLLLPLHRRRGQVYVPAEILSATGLDRDSFLKGEDRPAIGAAIAALAGLGRDHLAKARSAGTTISAANFPAFLTVALAKPVFDKAEKAGAGLFEQSILAPQWKRQWRMWRASRTRRF